MEAKIKEPYLERLYSNRHSDSSLVQFILLEFIETLHETRCLKEFCLHLKTFSQKRVDSEKVDLEKSHLESNDKEDTDYFLLNDYLKDIAVSLRKLLGPAQDYKKSFFWHLEGGRLNKLKHYVSLLRRNEGSHVQKLSAIQNEIDKGWLYCLKCLDSISAIQESPNSQTSISLPYLSLYRGLVKEVSTLNRLARLFIDLIFQFSTDENVIFFLIRYYQKFEVIYGSYFKNKIINKIFPEGLNEIKQFLIEKYIERGYENLVPVISQSIATLKK